MFGNFDILGVLKAIVLCLVAMAATAWLASTDNLFVPAETLSVIAGFSTLVGILYKRFHVRVEWLAQSARQAAENHETEVTELYKNFRHEIEQEYLRKLKDIQAYLRDVLIKFSTSDLAEAAHSAMTEVIHFLDGHAYPEWMTLTWEEYEKFKRERAQLDPETYAEALRAAADLRRENQILSSRILADKDNRLKELQAAGRHFANLEAVIREITVRLLQTNFKAMNPVAAEMRYRITAVAIKVWGESSPLITYLKGACATSGLPLLPSTDGPKDPKEE